MLDCHHMCTSWAIIAQFLAWNPCSSREQVSRDLQAVSRMQQMQRVHRQLRGRPSLLEKIPYNLPDHEARLSLGWASFQRYHRRLSE